MKKVIWEWHGQIMKDYWLFNWIQISKHFKGVSLWAVEFHRKNSNKWYRNLSKRTVRGGWKSSRLTIRSGRRIVGIGKMDILKYYDSVNILSITESGKITYLRPDTWGVDVATGKKAVVMYCCEEEGCGFKSSYGVDIVEHKNHHKALKLIKGGKELDDFAEWANKAYPSQTWLN